MEKPLNEEGGESTILLCSDQAGQKVVAKIFIQAEGKGQHSLEAREKVFDFMQTDVGRKLVLPVLDFGTAEVHNGYYNYFEIMPFCEGGDMANRDPIPFDALVDIIRNLNESLHEIHSAGIIHLDLKPENLYRLGSRVVIGDFGIARTTQKTYTYTMMGTDGYRAPEMVLAPTAKKAAYMLGPFSDYYSLGVTLACLYEGHYIYDDMGYAEITSAILNSHLPLSYHNDPHQEQLEKLLDGLVQYDAHRRFKYEDVVKWLNDHDYTGSQASEAWPKTFTFGKKKLKDEQQLFSALTADQESWEEAKVFFTQQVFEAFFRSFRPDLFRTAQLEAMKYGTSEPDVGLAHFLKALYPPGAIVWRGYTWNKLSDLAAKMMNTRVAANYGEILRKCVISHWLEHTTGILRSDENLKLIRQIEEVSRQYPEIACYWFGFAFSKEKEFLVNEKAVGNLDDWYKEAFQSSKLFYAAGGIYQQLMDPVYGAKLYGFLASFGYWERMAQALKEAEICTEYDKYQLLLSLLETIANNEAVSSMERFRVFYLYYGPVSIAYQVCRLQQQAHIYQALTPEGQEIIGKLESFQLPNPRKISLCLREMMPLMKLTDRLVKHMQNNPFLPDAGIYENADIACGNVQGYFCFDFIGRKAPLVLEYIIDSN